MSTKQRPTYYADKLMGIFEESHIYPKIKSYYRAYFPFIKMFFLHEKELKKNFFDL